MSLEARAEVLKLARLLDRDPEDLGYLGAADAEDLAALREQVTDALFDGDRDALGRIAEAGKVVPVGFMATARTRFSPRCCSTSAITSSSAEPPWPSETTCSAL